MPEENKTVDIDRLKALVDQSNSSGIKFIAGSCSNLFPKRMDQAQDTTRQRPQQLAH